MGARGSLCGDPRASAGCELSSWFCCCWFCGCWAPGRCDGGEFEEENLADILENHEPRRWGGVPLGPFCFSIEPDRESRRGLLGTGAGAVAGSWWWPLVLECPFASAGAGVVEGLVIWRGSEGAGALFGGEFRLGLSIQVKCQCQSIAGDGSRPSSLLPNMAPIADGQYRRRRQRW